MSVTEPVYISYLNYIGSGAPADGDQITRDNSTYPLNCVYTDRDSGITYVRKATTKVAATDWQAGSSGGATEVTVYQLKTILTDAQIKTLPTASVELVPAPGGGKLLIFHQAVILPKITAGKEYTNVGTNQASDGSSVTYNDGFMQPSIFALLQILTQNGQFLIIPAGGFISNSNEWAQSGLVGDCVNAPLKLYTTNETFGGTNYTGGDPANTMEVTVFYSIVDL